METIKKISLIIFLGVTIPFLFLAFYKTQILGLGLTEVREKPSIYVFQGWGITGIENIDVLKENCNGDIKKISENYLVCLEDVE